MIADFFVNLTQEKRRPLFRVTDSNNGRRVEIETADASAEVKIVLTPEDLHNLARKLREADRLETERD